MREDAILGVVNVVTEVQRALAELAPGAKRPLAAVSGGADSLALLVALIDAGFAPVAGHLDHRLRPDSGSDAQFVTAVCRDLGVELLVEQVDVAKVASRKGWNLEDAGRRLRYEFLDRAASRLGADVIVTGHTKDDQAETVLMQILRGTAHATGAARRRGRIVRPLLRVRHETLAAFLRERGLTWLEDETNRDTRLLRAWLRHELLPKVTERLPRTPDVLSRHATIQTAVAQYLTGATRRFRHPSGGFDAERLRHAHAAVQRQAIAQLLEEAGFAPDFGRVEEVRQQLGREGTYRLSLGEGTFLRLAYGRLEIAREKVAPEERRVTLPEELPPGVDASVLELPDLVLRARRPGDRMRLPGGSRSLKRLLIDRKVPREERSGLTVLASGDRVLWVEGIGPAADVRSEPGGGVDDRAESFMRRALELARSGGEAGELPVGAVVVREGRIIAEAHNETEGSSDPTAHAEILAMRRAAQSIGDWRLSGCTLFVTLEPCPMCAGAMLQAHLDRVVYGAANPRDGALGSVTDILAEPWKRKVEVGAGLLAVEAARLLSEFFERRRKPPRQGAGGAG